MLWSELKLVTRDGQSLEGDDVRSWLEQRDAIPGGGGPTVEIVTNQDPRVVLRTPEEVTAWLLDVQLCKHVDPVASPPPVVVLPRRVARGKKSRNHLNIPSRVEFLDDQSRVVTQLALVQAACVRVTVRVNPAPRRASRKLELAFIGAKIRSRSAIRSVRDPDEDWRYRYLSRVRVARADNGIGDPLLELNRSVLSRAVARATKHLPSHEVYELTLMGLEAGVEQLQACLLDNSGNVYSTAVLQITVTRPATDVGALRVFHNTTVDNFLAADPEFDTIHAASANRGGEVRLGICDTGIFDDQAGDNYLAARWHAGRYFDGDAARDRPTQAYDHNNDHYHHILDFRESPSMHGTNVAGQAAWGTDKIKLVDVMVQRGQEMGSAQADAAAQAAARAFTWARDDQGVSVVNCSKVMPFNMDATNDVVAHQDTTSRVLFLATAGNSNFSFPLNTSQPSAANNEVTADNMPTSMVNTLWGGGCKRDRTPHPSRGHGPAVEVMVPSDNPHVYSPREVRRAFRMKMLQKVYTDLPLDLDNREFALGDPPQMVQGGLTPDEQAEYDDLDRRGFGATYVPGFGGPFGGIHRKKYIKLEAKLAPRPNPDYALKHAYSDLATTIRTWALDVSNDTQRAATLVAWAQNLFQANDDLKRDDTVAANFGGLANIAGAARTTVQQLLNETIERKNLRAHATELGQINQQTPNVASDDGVSFGLPVVANIAAKLKLINRDLTPNQIKRIIIDTSDIDPGFETQCIARGIVNPLRAYLAAHDGYVATGGHPHHDYRPTVSGIPEPRRVYYTFFHMDSEGLALYNAIRQRLVASYAAMDIDLVEAEPPVAIRSEPLTYVEGPTILRHNWRAVVPVDEHPLLYPGRQLRLILVNETALVLGNALAATLEDHGIDQDLVAHTWTPEVAGGNKAVLTPRVIQTQNQQVWTCQLRIPNTPDLARFTFVDNVEHLVTGFAPLLPGRPQAEQIQVGRVDDRRAWIRVLDPNLNQQLTAEPRVSFSLGVVQRLGGARKGRNIFVNNKYHAGPTGTPAAHSSALVLFQHEIAHALGMVNPNGHATYYDRQLGGEGDHCAFNTERKTNAEAPNFGIIGDGQGGEVVVPLAVSQPQAHGDDVPCVMYHTRSSAHSRSTFCAECIRHLREVIDPNTWRWNSD